MTHDYRDLLLKYMAMVGDAEGCLFVTHAPWVTAVEVAELDRLGSESAKYHHGPLTVADFRVRPDIEVDRGRGPYRAGPDQWWLTLSNGWRLSGEVEDGTWCFVVHAVSPGMPTSARPEVEALLADATQRLVVPTWVRRGPPTQVDWSLWDAHAGAS